MKPEIQTTDLSLTEFAIPRLDAIDICEALSSGDIRIDGARGSLATKILADARVSLSRPLLLLCPDPESAEDLSSDLAFFGCGENLHFFPAWEVLPSETEHPDVDVAARQVAALKALHENTTPPPWIVAPIAAILQPTIPTSILKSGRLMVERGQEVSPAGLAARLAESGMEIVAQVEAPGQYSRRGGILDVFPLLGDEPYRMEFFGDEVESIRPFDPVTQESGPALTRPVALIEVSRDSFRLAYDGGKKAYLADHIHPSAIIALWHPERVGRVAGLYADSYASKTFSPFADSAKQLSNGRNMCVFPDLDGDKWPEEEWRPANRLTTIETHGSGWERLSGGMDVALSEMRLLAAKGTQIFLFCHNDAEQKRLTEVISDKASDLLSKIKLSQGKLSRGFIYGEGSPNALAVAIDHELLGRQVLRRVPRRKHSGMPINDFTELREGDYVVHVANGIARYEGIATLDQNGAEHDFLVLRFAEDARIYVPLSHVDLVQRYVGVGESRPQLSKLGSPAWNRRKAEVEKAVRDIAQDLLDTQAKRRLQPGIAFPPDDDMVREFEKAFPYEDTPDQASAADDIRSDQLQPSPMDRLLCGDVGFGKTEMAVRAAFRVANAGMQTAVLVPTTILAEQHYRTFRDRMADFPATVACLSRFRSPTEQKIIIDRLREGKVDVVVGTHRLLSKDIAFKDLGLIVIDEEQKFGVEHKERLKRYRESVDILTMTATPIPRTLHMALLGLRDISNLTTAPRERHSVRTSVVRWSDAVVRRAILREMARGGQCFFLHNRVHNIDDMAGMLQELVPEARIAIGHGQMAEGELLEVMTRFLDGQIDVLVCTTIIESGVDIPNVNTLFVNDADHFGLSELHQLRGRVGRYRHQAYAYFLVPPKRPPTPEAQKRLDALQEYTELGSGFRIAMRDLEIRGAGNLLGVEQSGHIHLIGFDLYCRLLEKAVAARKGEKIEDPVPVEMDLGSKSFIPPEYIPSDTQRVDFYRRLGRIGDIKALDDFRAYIRDRYGVSPQPVERCFADQELRVRMLAVGINYMVRMDRALAVGFSGSASRRIQSRLRTYGRKITPMGNAKWRVELESFESESIINAAEKLLAHLEKDPGEETAASSAKTKSQRRFKIPTAPVASPSPDVSSDLVKPKRHKSKVVPPAPNTPPARLVRKKVRPAKSTKEEQKKAEVTSPIVAQPMRRTTKIKKPTKPKGLSIRPPPIEVDSDNDGMPGAKVFGMSPDQGHNLLSVTVLDSAFSPVRYERMTIVIGESSRHSMRCVGSNSASPGKTSLLLKTDNPSEIDQVAEAYLAAGGARIFEGIA